ncbi:thioesterase II family protein [Actinomadura meridiana]
MKSSHDALWTRCYERAVPDAPRLVCFPHAGGAASYYRPLALTLAPRIEVLAVQYPGRQDRHREACVEDVHRIADQIVEALPPEDGRDLAFFGHSMGAVIAFEVARRLHDRGGPVPARLFASGRRAPSRHREEGAHLLDDAGLLDEIGALGGTDSRLLEDSELLSVILPVVRSDYRAIETYSHAPGPPLPCPVTAVVGDGDPRATVDEARAWADHCTGDFQLHVLPGGHFYLDAQRDAVVKIITESLCH